MKSGNSPETQTKVKKIKFIKPNINYEKYSLFKKK